MTASTTTSGSDQRARVRLRQVLVLALSGVMALVMVFLGVWQMSVYRTQGVRNLERRAAEAPVSLDDELARGTAVGTMYGRQVRLHGHYLNRAPVLVGTSAPYRIVQPFQDHTRVVGIVRGVTSSTSAASVSPAPSGERDQVGVLMPSEGQGNAAQAQAARKGILPTLNLESLAQQWPDGVLPGFVTLSASDAGAQQLSPATVRMPDNASGRAQNLGYAMQWWVFAIFAVVMGIVFARTIGRRGSSAAAGTAAPRPRERTGPRTGTPADHLASDDEAAAGPGEAEQGRLGRLDA